MAEPANKSEMAQESAPKEQVIDRPPKRIKALQFGLFSPSQIAAQSVVDIKDRNLYDIGTAPGTPRTVTQKGPLDPRLGTSNKTGHCETCGKEMIKCNGHFGQIQLTLPCFHYGYFKKIIDVLNCVCKECSFVMLPAKEKRAVLKRLRVRDLDRIQKARVVSNISDSCKKVRICPHCNAHNGPVRKVGGHPIKMYHNKFAIYTSSNAKSKKKPAEMEEYEASFKQAIDFNPEVGRHMKRVADDITPIRALNIFRKIPNADVELLGMSPGQGGRPEYMIWTHLPAPPVAIRPSVAQESASTEDDVTNKLGDIIQINNTLSAALRAGQPLSRVMDMWEFMSVQIAMYIDGNLPGLQKGDYGKAMRGFCQRLKGKQGRFRGNLSGKRVDFSGRTVISPDPNLSIEEVAVPARVAVNMTYPEKVTKYNIDKLKACVRRGDKKHPGANFVIKADSRRIVLRIVNVKGALDKIADSLKIGDTVDRHLEDGDIVLFNRQPSLHKLSILSHKVKVRPWRTFRLNECVCNPYNADFDGDEMNLHVPQTEEARAEAMELMGVKHNLATPKNGTPIIAAIQDFITGAYLVSQKEVFLNRTQFTHIMSSMFNGMSVRDPVTGEEYPVELPPPTILKPQFLWTGKQVWNMIMKPNRRYPVDVNVDAGLKQFAVPPRGVAPDMVENDAYMVIRNSEVMCGAFDKAAIGDGKKNSVFFVIMRDFGPDYAAAAMNRLSKLSARWLGEQGFSIGINDVHPSEALNYKKAALVKAAYDKCDIIIRKFLDGKLERATGCDEEQTMEISVSGILSDVRQACGGACFAELSRLNAPLIMAMCGSKGSNINVSQMVAAVGQQTIGNKRVMDGFQDRSLPHFKKGSREPLAKGFVVDSFFSGLSPTEFVFHAMTGREGLVDTAVKTAETGYMSRRLIKSLEDLSTRYDQTVRNSASGIVQMKFGDDGLDPVDMEGTAVPVNFDRTFSHAVTSTWDNAERGLLKDEIVQLLDEVLNRERAKLPRFSEDKSPLPYKETNEKDVDQMESNRVFLDHVETYVMGEAAKMMSSQKRLSHSENLFKLSASALKKFLNLCLLKFEKSKVEAGHSVGVVGAQSIGEPGTQMTLKTFHFAGVAGMSITQGVPRIKEIINASKVISTPIITCILDSPYEEMAARFVKARIEKMYVKDIVNYVEDVWEPGRAFINLRIDWSLVMNLGLSLSASDITRAIDSAKGMKALNVFSEPFSSSHIRIRIGAPSARAKTKTRANPKGKIVELCESAQIYENVQIVKRKLAEIAITGYPDAHRAVIKKDDKPDKTGKEPISVFVEGYGLKACMTTEGVNGYKTTTNNVMECMGVLGIEAARQTIISEISSVMGNMDIDPRHMRLLADVMTRKGEVLGISRFGLAKSNDSVLQLASFERTPDHLFDAAVKSKVDAIEGVSECIIMGQSMGMGTGAMEVVRPLNLDGITHEVPKSDFHVAFREVMAGRRQRTAERMAKYYKRPEAVTA